MNVIHVERTVCPGQASHIVTTFLQAFRTGLSREELIVRVHLLLHLLQDLANFIRERIVPGYAPFKDPLRGYHTDGASGYSSTM